MAKYRVYEAINKETNLTSIGDFLQIKGFIRKSMPIGGLTVYYLPYARDPGGAGFWEKIFRIECSDEDALYIGLTFPHVRVEKEIEEE